MTLQNIITIILHYMSIYFQNNLKYLRDIKGKTLADIGLLVDKKHNTIGNWEKGIGSPNIEEITLLSQFFDIPIDDFINKNVQVKKIKGKEKTRKIVQVNVQEDVQVNKQNVSSNTANDDNPNLLHDGDPPYNTPDEIIKTLSIAIKGLEAANAILQQRNTILEQENERLKRDAPVIGKHMEDKDAKSA